MQITIIVDLKDKRLYQTALRAKTISEIYGYNTKIVQIKDKYADYSISCTNKVIRIATYSIMNGLLAFWDLQ